MKRLLFLLALFALPAQADEYFPLTSQWLSYDATSQAMSNATGAQVRYVQVTCTTDCFFALASSGAATVAVATTSSATATTSYFLPANTPRIFKSAPSTTVVVIKAASAANGLINVIELTK